MRVGAVANPGLVHFAGSRRTRCVTKVPRCQSRSFGRRSRPGSFRPWRHEGRRETLMGIFKRGIWVLSRPNDSLITQAVKKEQNKYMVRPERRVVLAGASPVWVSAGAPGSRLQPSGEIRPCRAECRKPLKKRGANQRATTTGERCSLVIFSAERRLGGPSRSYHGEGNRQHFGPEGMLDLLGVAGGDTSGQSNAEQERPYLAAKSGKHRAYKVGWLKSRGQEGVRGVRTTNEGVHQSALEGKDPALVTSATR